MFRLIKKWYFKIYHLFKLLGIFILVFGIRNVYAEEYNTCFDEFKAGEVSFSNQSTYWKKVNPLLNVQPDTTYYLRFFSENPYNCNTTNGVCFGDSFIYFNSNNVSVGSLVTTSTFDKETQILTFKTPNNQDIAKGQPSIYTFNSNYNDLNGATMIMSTNKDDILTCQIIPEPEESVYSTFLDLYIEKIQYLAEGFIENEYLFSMVAIIFAWVVLEMFLKILHLKGGYRK